ncbi:MAG: hypothetical protein LBL23_05465 [Coriobacteriales bacterium]|jgi:hypothetical protein|nr:hypothetical protein [Coriobacteriales bacterium]
MNDTKLYSTRYRFLAILLALTLALSQAVGLPGLAFADETDEVGIETATDTTTDSTTEDETTETEAATETETAAEEIAEEVTETEPAVQGGSLYTGIAGDPYVLTGTMTQLWNGGSPTPAVSGTHYSIENQTELEYLRSYISGAYNSVGVTFFLTAEINLASAWTPIGVSSGLAFNGIFDGSNNDPTAPHTISGLTVAAGSGGSYYGLFGYSTGPILNLNVNGAIASPPTAVSIEYVGGIVGYTTNDVYNCQSNVSINVPNAQNVGGVVGAIENLATVPIVSPFHVQASSSKANITGESRVGGVVGSVYCHYSGNIVVDNCYYSNGGDVNALTLTATANQSREWSGGIVGYCQGYITNSYTVATINSLNSGHYIAGLAGILNGEDPQALLSNSYAAVAFGSGTDPAYDRPLYGSTDNSDTLAINNVLYDYDLTQDGVYFNTPGTGKNGWGYWQQTGDATTAQLKAFNQPVREAFNGGTQITPSPTTEAVLGSAFAKDDGSKILNGSYPILIWQPTALELPTYTPGNGTYNPPSETGLFIDGLNGDDGNAGTSRDAPVKSIGVVLDLWKATPGNIYMLNTSVLTGNELDLNTTDYRGAHFVRSATFTGVLFTVPSGVNAPLSAVIIDGNNSNVVAAFSLINVTGGNLTVGYMATLAYNSSADGGAISVSSGSATVTAGELYRNDAKRGGAVYVVAGASFTLNDPSGLIDYNHAQNVGGAIASRGSVHIINGAIRDNVVASPGAGSGAYGGALAVMGGSATINGGSIGHNTASAGQGQGGKAYGGAIYIDAGTVDITGGTIGAYGSVQGNSAQNGGGVYNNEGTTLNITGGSITGNSASVSGGGLFSSGYTVMTNGSITNNATQGSGGGVYITASTGGNAMALNGGTISGNTASSAGNGIYLADMMLLTFNSGGTGSTLVVSDVVYLAANVEIYIDATMSNVSGVIPVNMPDAHAGRVIAEGYNPQVTSGSARAFSVPGWTVYASGTYLMIQ